MSEHSGIPETVIVESIEYALRAVNRPLGVPMHDAVGHIAGLGHSIPMTEAEFIKHLEAAYTAGRLRYRVKGKGDFSQIKEGK